ncbi:MAG: hypothetical protein LBB98_03695, partial [Treponema sp.]|nr:hypothetical protein [Treponema sp.]
MAINSSAAPPRVGDKMRYAIPAAIADWKRLFSGETPKPAVPVGTPKRKPPAKKTAPKVESGPQRKSPPEAAALVFIKKEPVTFQVRRQEHPEDFERMVFVVKACAKNGGDRALSVLHVEQIREGSWLAASDGKRLHAAFTQRKIRSGDYKPVITRDTVSLGEPVTGIMFPNWRRVIPGDTVKRGTIDLADSGWG